MKFRVKEPQDHTMLNPKPNTSTQKPYSMNAKINEIAFKLIQCSTIIKLKPTASSLKHDALKTEIVGIPIERSPRPYILET